MKKTSSKIQLLLAGAVALMFTSCLGESENSRTAKGEFVYITTINNAKVAAFSYGYLSSDALAGLSDNDCALIDYKVNFNQSNNFTYRPDFLNIDPVNTFPARNQFTATITEQDVYENMTKNDAFENVAINAFWPDEHLGDRWLFEYTYQKYGEEEAPEFRVYYNPNTQDGEDLNKGIVTLDCIFARTGGSSVGITPQRETTKAVVNFKHLRNVVAVLAKPEEGAQDTKRITFKFRCAATSSSNTEKGYEVRTFTLSNGYYLLYTAAK
ncbi:hypothetical protein [Viscerimonas tarda]